MEGADQACVFESMFYEELDTTSRGSTIADQSTLDFYVEADDTTRGASLGVACLRSVLLSSSGTQDFETAVNACESNCRVHIDKLDVQNRTNPQTALSSYKQPLLEHGNKLLMRGISQSEMPEFQQTAQPPEVPFGGLAGPTVVLEKARAADVMKSIYVHVQDEPGMSVTKVRLQKCSMTIVSFVHEGDLLLQCSVKARLFKLGTRDGPNNPHNIVVEFQRRDGDAIASAQIFNRIFSDLRARFILEENSKEDASSAIATLVTPSLPITAAEQTFAVLQPYIDILANTTSSAEQADVLAATAVLVQKSPKLATAVAAALAAQPQGVLQALQASPIHVVTYPALMLETRLHENAHPWGIH